MIRNILHFLCICEIIYYIAVNYHLLKTAFASHLRVNKAAIAFAEDRITNAFQYFEFKRQKINISLHVGRNDLEKCVGNDHVLGLVFFFWGGGRFEHVKNMIPVGGGGRRMG